MSARKTKNVSEKKTRNRRTRCVDTFAFREGAFAKRESARDAGSAGLPREPRDADEAVPLPPFSPRTDRALHGFAAGHVPAALLELPAALVDHATAGAQTGPASTVVAAAVLAPPRALAPLLRAPPRAAVVALGVVAGRHAAHVLHVAHVLHGGVVGGLRVVRGDGLPFHHRHLNASAGRAAPRATTKARHSARRAPRGAARRDRARRVGEEEVEEESVMTRNGRFRMGVGTRVASFESRESDEAARRAWLVVLARSKGILGHRDHERSGASKEVRGGTSDETLDACPEKKRTFEAENEPRIVDVLARLGRATARPGPLETPNPRLEPRTPGSIRARVL